MASAKRGSGGNKATSGDKDIRRDRAKPAASVPSQSNREPTKHPAKVTIPDIKL